MTDLLIPGPTGKLEASLWSPTPASGARGSSSAPNIARDAPTNASITRDAPGAARGACVVCHPHPLYGGTMNSSVVFRTARGLQRAGLRVLRFNYRGVGKSEGVHDGHGGEAEDLGAALEWLARETPGVELWAAGFSFGARTVAARAALDARIARIVLVALPVAAFDCSAILRVQQPGMILMAGNDEYGTLGELRRQFPKLDARLELDEIQDTGHFFDGATAEVQRRVQAYAERVLEGKT